MAASSDLASRSRLLLWSIENSFQVLFIVEMPVVMFSVMFVLDLYTVITFSNFFCSQELSRTKTVILFDGNKDHFE